MTRKKGISRKQEMEINQQKLQLLDLSSQYQASNNREKALLALSRTIQEKEGEVERLGNLKLKKSSRKLQHAEQDTSTAEAAAKELQDRLQEYFSRTHHSDQLRRTEEAFAEQNLRLQEKQFAKLACQLADTEAERLELKKEKLKWSNAEEEPTKIEVK